MMPEEDEFDIYRPDDGNRIFGRPRGWMIFAFVAALILAGLLLSLATSLAHAEVQCDTSDNVHAFLANKYGEVVTRSELAFDGEHFVGLLEWTENKDTTTWSLLLTDGGRTCLLFSGTKKMGFQS